MLKCSCGNAYVGQTSRSIKNRLNEHRSSIRLFKTKTAPPQEEGSDKKQKYGETWVEKHFFENGHQVGDLKWQIVEQ